ncbi:KR-domain-containing protein [Pleomassaria siparia CBS 279.74]|uniref:KR-domain-containing protein n=1 Tax=Pleomassaria siparia CBS 279.74 TaxID=1314801 RepID=A0A6G1JWV2_9PLEO|nr:KR-domain-containing protein [Pleomassaria siparia CBS 279.74]
MERYGLAEDHIFYNRDTSFADGIMRVTKGRGVDVVLNSVSRRLLEASWNSVAKFGRFIEIGRKDVDTRGYLPMYPFIMNLSFSGVDLTMVLQENIKLGHELIKKVMTLAGTGELKPVYPLHPHKVVDVEKAFRFMQSGKSLGKIVLELERHHVVPTVLSGKPEYQLSSNATFLIAGGLGGIGRKISAWLVERGAKHLILLSRSSLDSNKRAIVVVEELRKQGIEVKCPRCDISDLVSLRAALEECSSMPPIRGCFQATMSIRDNTFDRLTIDDWRECTLPKLQGSWNLHLALPSGLDFFVLLSSACGVFGNAGQGGYAAGNTYLDALARYRTARGEKAVALDLGILLGEGYVAENEQVMTRLLRMNLLAPMSLDKLFAMLDYYCNPDCHFTTEYNHVDALVPPHAPDQVVGPAVRRQWQSDEQLQTAVRQRRFRGGGESHRGRGAPAEAEQSAGAAGSEYRA